MQALQTEVRIAQGAARGRRTAQRGVLDYPASPPAPAPVRKMSRTKAKKRIEESHRGRAAAKGCGSQDAALTASQQSLQQAGSSGGRPVEFYGSQQGSCAATLLAAGGTAAHSAAGRGQRPGGLPGSTGYACPVRFSQSSRPAGRWVVQQGGSNPELPGRRQGGWDLSLAAGAVCPLPAQPAWKVAPLTPFYC